MTMLDTISVLIINFQTPDLLRTAVESFRSHYPSVHMVIIDNGSQDGSVAAIREFTRPFAKDTELVTLPSNIFHGPAMHLGITQHCREHCFVLDSDTKTLKGGFLEAMAGDMERHPDIYCIGRLDMVNNRGFISERGEVPAVRTAYMLLRRSQYLRLPPFEHHGLPTLRNFTAARAAGLRLRSFPIDESVEHFGRGTASRFGYQLGFRSKLDYLLNKFGL